MGVVVLVLALVAAAAAVDVQIAAVQGLLSRVAPEHARFFRLELFAAQGMDVWEVETVGDFTVLRGTSGVALAAAFNW